MSQEDKIELARKFTEVSNVGLDKFEQTVTLKLLRSLLNLKCKMNPLWLIEIVGPFFFKQREFIAARDLDHFIQMDYWDQRRDWMELTRGYGESVAFAFETHIKETLKILREKDPKALETIPVQLLKMYAKYVQMCQTQS